MLAGLLALSCTTDLEESSIDSTAPGGRETAAVGSPSACVGSEVVVSKRVVRLTEYQLLNSYAALFGADGARTISEDEQSPSLTEREFPPIGGDVGVSERLVGKYDRLAQSAMDYVLHDSDALTPCGATPSDVACVQQYLLSFAERAFRHPLSVAEENAISGQFLNEMQARGATAREVLGFGIYGVLSSPSFIYRTEFGADVAEDSALTPYELASSLAFFLTDRPPDDELLRAAASGRLTTPSEVRAEATRLLATPEARRNLENALIKYFSLTKAPSVILNPEATPGLRVTGGLQSSIYHEGELFMRNMLWSGPLSDLLISRRTWTNAEIASEIYGVSGPSELDEDGFGMVELPADRSGLLTLSTFLLAGARSTGGSPVARGLAVNGSVVCEVNPPFPQVVNPETGELEPNPEIADAITALADKSERDKAEYRRVTPECAGCHRQFDPYGMVLEPYDAVGRLRSTDLDGRPIDETWTTTTLPESVGGALVTSAAETAQALAHSGALERCIAMNFINFALSEVSRGGANNTDLASGPQTASCAVEGVIDDFTATDRSFASLMREIAASTTLAVRSKGL